ncbi:26376_t:CDS:2, partial [Racocetra persica]
PVENRKVGNISLDDREEVYLKKPEYSPDPDDEKAQESRFVNKLNNKASEEEAMILMEALLDV